MKLKRQFKSPTDKERYFKAVVRNMSFHDKDKQAEVSKHEILVGDTIYDKRKKVTNIDEQLAEKDLLGWIELIENPKLYRAIKKLSVEEQIFIRYIIRVVTNPP